MPNDPYRLSGVAEASSDADLIGKEWAIAIETDWPPHGLVGFPVPASWVLLLDTARHHLQRAEAQRALLPALLVPFRSPNPQPVRGWQPPRSELTAFFRHAAAGIVLCHTALDTWSADMIPLDLEVQIQGKVLRREELAQRGLERRLTQITSTWSGKPNLHGDPRIQLALEGKVLRDSIQHAGQPTVPLASAAEQSVFVRLLRWPNLPKFVDNAWEIIRYYAP